MLEIASISIEIFILILFGILSRSLHILEDTGRNQISKLVFNIALPCLLFTSAAGTDFASISGLAALSFLAGMMIPVLAYGIGQLAAWLGRTSGTQRQVIRVATAFSNTAFFDIPICTMLWGPQAGLLASCYDQGINLPIFILGPIGYSAKPNIKGISKAIINPMILSMLAGFAVNLLHIEVPGLLLSPLISIGNMTSPLALILVGSLLDFKKMNQITVKPLALLVGLRLLIAPLVIGGLALFLAFDPAFERIVILQAAMPTSVLGTLMAFEYHSDENLAVQGNLLSVLVSPVTLALFVALIRNGT